MTIPSSRPPRNRARVSSKNQVTVPKEVRDKLKLKPGDVVNFSDIEKLSKLPKKGVLVTVDRKAKLRPWTDEEWQQAEREADEDIAAGRVSGPFYSADDLIAHLHKAARKYRKR
jgi:AbrB family looped-hinge helix DNA binding protein